VDAGEPRPAPRTGALERGARERVDGVDQDWLGMRCRLEAQAQPGVSVGELRRRGEQLIGRCEEEGAPMRTRPAHRNRLLLIPG
jgi:hypothetical protein